MKQELSRIIAQHHEGGITSKDCMTCSSGCCSHGGFAILENVEAIYEVYQAGDLKREGFEFKKGLSLKQFIFEYFDVWCRPVHGKNRINELMFFHMKSIDDHGRLISMPGNLPSDMYWKIRRVFFENNPWLNKGCVFLSHPVPNWPEDDKNSKRHCILHEKKSTSGMQAKPIDCSFYTCVTPFSPKTPTDKTTADWLQALNEAYQNSKTRFLKIYNKKS